MDQLEGWGRRAYAAHLNSLEVFPMFAAAALSTEILDADDCWASGLSIAFILLRGLYLLIYLCNINNTLATLRSIVFTCGIAVVAALFVLALIA